MKLLFASLGILSSVSATLGGAYIRIYTDGSILRVTFEMRYIANDSTPRMFDVTYNGVTVRSPVINGKDSNCPSVSIDFTYDDSIKSVTFVSPNTTATGGYYDLFYNGAALGSKSYTASWKVSANDPMNVGGSIKSVSGMIYRQPNTVALDVTMPETYTARIFRMYARYWPNTSVTNPFVHEIVQNIPFVEEYTYTAVNYTGGKENWYSVMLGFYANGVDPEVEPDNCVEYLELVSPVYISFTASQVPTPMHLSYDAPAAGGKVKITWDMPVTNVAQAITGSELERSTNGGSSWTKIYKDVGTSFTDTVGSDWETVMYRVRLYNSSLSLNYYTGEQKSIVQTNLFIGAGGIPVAVSGLYLGKGGIPVAISPLLHVGR